MLSTIGSQKVVLTEEEETYLAKISEEEIENIKKCFDRSRNNITTLDCDGISAEQYKGLNERQGTSLWPTYTFNSASTLGEFQPNLAGMFGMSDVFVVPHEKCYNSTTVKDPEKDTIKRIGTRLIAEAMARHITDKKASIIDIGAGTGCLAAAVKRCGFFNIDCMEPVQNMIDMQPEGLFGKVYRDVISSSQPCKIETGLYDCAILLGVINTGHLEVEDFPELLRVIKQGGIVVFTLPDYWCKYKNYGIRLDAFLQENLEKGIVASVFKERVTYVPLIEDATLYVVKNDKQRM